MGNATQVEAIYLEKELVRVQFPHCNLVSDHPVGMGGAGRGPSPGEIMLAALTSASVFRARDEAQRRGTTVTSLVARAGMRADREGSDGPLHALAYLGRIWRRLEVSGSLLEEDAAAIGASVGILEALRNGIELEERVDFTRTEQRRPPTSWRNTVFLDNEHVVDDLAPGATMVGEDAGRWRASAVLIDDDSAIVETTGAPILVSRVSGARGPTPYELLLGSLASCTAVYVGRNAQFEGIPLDRVTVTVTAACPSDLSMPVRAMLKVTEVTGLLTAAEEEKCRFFAEFCALGETLKRGAEIIDEITPSLATAASGTLRSPFADIDRASPLPVELECDDGTCCIPGPPGAGTAQPMQATRQETLSR
jgi:uncharacterized OsmC-like protein